jgi:hypothetical protein
LLYDHDNPCFIINMRQLNAENYCDLVSELRDDDSREFETENLKFLVDNKIRYMFKSMLLLFLFILFHGKG